jgi:putative aminophosphonate oxidoreductase
VDGGRAFWLQEALGDAPPEPPLRGADRADVAIMGGGYVGLWTAIRIKEKDAGCDVVVLEQDVCGGGASGRNGGMVLSWWLKLSSLLKICGEEEALRLGRASEAAIDEIRAFCEANAVDAHFRRGGFLWTARGEAHVGAWEGVVGLCERLGVGAFERLDPEEVSRRAGSPTHLAGVFEAKGATVQPALLARGLRRVALEKGVRIHEGTRVLAFDRDRPLAIRTDGGLLAAKKLVLANGAWAAGLPEMRMSMVVVSSDMIATEPIPGRLEEIGWTSGEGIADSQMMVDYYRTTRDGRIAFGKGVAGVGFGGRIDGHFDRSARRAAVVAADFRHAYPALSDVRVEHDWSGPIDRTPNSVPIFGHLGGREHIVYGLGWSGNGVGPSVMGGKILASLALGLDDEWSRSPLVDRRRDLFPPEPVRFLAAQVVRRAVVSKERAEMDGKAPHWLAVRLAALAPAGMEDKGASQTPAGSPAPPVIPAGEVKD